MPGKLTVTAITGGQGYSVTPDLCTVNVDGRTTPRWPAFALPTDSRLRSALLDAAHAFGVDTEPKIAGPSNIGNYLAGLAVPATAGFDVTYTGLHATDERFRTGTVPTVQVIYHATLLKLLSRH